MSTHCGRCCTVPSKHRIENYHMIQSSVYIQGKWSWSIKEIPTLQGMGTKWCCYKGEALGEVVRTATWAIHGVPGFEFWLYFQFQLPANMHAEKQVHRCVLSMWVIWSCLVIWDIWKVSQWMQDPSLVLLSVSVFQINGTKKLGENSVLIVWKAILFSDKIDVILLFTTIWTKYRTSITWS